jgi:hypothetical protein
MYLVPPQKKKLQKKLTIFALFPTTLRLLYPHTPPHTPNIRYTASGFKDNMRLDLPGCATWVKATEKFPEKIGEIGYSAFNLWNALQAIFIAWHDSGYQVTESAAQAIGTVKAMPLTHSREKTGVTRSLRSVFKCPCSFLSGHSAHANSPWSVL